MGHDNYLHTLPQQQSHAMSAVVVNPSRSDTYQAMTATVETPKDDVSIADDMHGSADIFERANETFKNLPPWMLQRFATADLNINVNADPVLLSRIVQSAKDIITLRIEEGEELSRHLYWHCWPKVSVSLIPANY